MPLVDPSILTQGQSNRGGLLGDVMSLRKQRMGLVSTENALGEEDRAFKARQAFNESAEGNDPTTEEGLKAILSGMVRKGYAAEAQTIFQHAAPLFQQKQAPTPAKPDILQIEGERPFIIENGKAKFIEGAPIVPGKQKQVVEPIVQKVPGQVPYQVVDGEYRPIKGAPVIPKEEPKDNSSSVFAQEQQLRTQYLGQTKDYRDVRDAYSRVISATDNPSAAGDLALIFNFMKMLDPGSTVREGEFATAQNAAGVPERVRNSWNKAVNGERLSEPQRQDFLNQAKGLYGKAKSQRDATRTSYVKMASQYPGLDPNRVLMDDAMAGEPSLSSGPEVGSIEDGYRFKGGDPADPNSWEKAD